jgi:hypothetical protein
VDDDSASYMLATRWHDTTIARRDTHVFGGRHRDLLIYCQIYFIKVLITYHLSFRFNFFLIEWQRVAKTVVSIISCQPNKVLRINSLSWHSSHLRTLVPADNEIKKMLQMANGPASPYRKKTPFQQFLTWRQAPCS